MGKASFFALLAACAWGAVFSYDSYGYCTNYAEYNTLMKLKTNDTCMNIDSVFKLLTDITNRAHSGNCRVHVISELAAHFGYHPRIPSFCHCNGANRLQQYHQGPGDGVSDQRTHCINYDNDYRDLYNDFFNTGHQHAIPACRTHHSLWIALRQIPNHDLGDGNSCQKDIVFHLKYAFDQHQDKCTCARTQAVHQTTTSAPHGQQQHADDRCHHYDSFIKLQHLGDTNDCLSANSVWHYLDDLEVRNPECRKRIEKYLIGKYPGGSAHMGDECTCTARRALVSHQIQRIDNGSLTTCRDNTRGTYRQLTIDLFSNLKSTGCKNHDFLWSRLHGIHNYCSHYYNNHCSGQYTDCTRDLIIRAAIQYPTDDSDSCVCTKKSTTPIVTSTKAVATTQTAATTQTTPTVPTTSSTTSSAASATTVTVAAASTSAKPVVVPVQKYSCDKLSAVEDIAKSVHVTHPASSPCDSNTGSDDAYVLTECNVTSPSTWKKGANVMADCEAATHQIHAYIPISTFSGDSYVPRGAQSGIFLGCSNNGIRMAIQRCNGVPEIIHVESTAFTGNPRNYFVIV